MKINCIDHPKTADLCDRLGIPLTVAVGYLEMLWQFTAKHTPQGNIGKWSAGAIAKACGFTETQTALRADRTSPRDFLEALVGAGFVDLCAVHAFVIHDWDDHKPSWVSANLKREGLCVIVATPPGSPVELRALSEATSNQAKASQALPSQDVSYPETAAPSSVPQQAEQGKVEDPKPEDPKPADPKPKKPRRPAEPEPAPEDILLRFPCDGDPPEWLLTRQQVANWHRLFPSLKMGDECRAALAWIEANPERRKTFSGMPKFLVNWFTKSQNRSGGGGSAPAVVRPAATLSLPKIG